MFTLVFKRAYAARPPPSESSETPGKGAVGEVNERYPQRPGAADRRKTTDCTDDTDEEWRRSARTFQRSPFVSDPSVKSVKSVVKITVKNGSPIKVAQTGVAQPRAQKSKKKSPKSGGHGGARPGAGRPRENRQPVTMHLHPAVIEALRLRGRRIGEFVEPLVVHELVRLLATALRHSGTAPMPDYAHAIAQCLEKVGPGYVQSAIRLAERR